MLERALPYSVVAPEPTFGLIRVSWARQMENPIAKQAYDEHLKEAERFFHECAYRVDLAVTIGEKYGYEVPEWAYRVQGGDALATTPQKKRARSGERTEEKARDFPAPDSIEAQVLAVLESGDGTASNSELEKGCKALAGEDAPSYRQIRVAADKLRKAELIVKEEPGPFPIYNYWRLPHVPPRESPQKTPSNPNDREGHLFNEDSK